MRKLLFLLLLTVGAKVCAQNPDSLTFAVLGNSISTYYDYLPAGYAIYYSQDREKNYGFQVGDTWWMQLSRFSGLTFLANASWSGSRVACDVLNSNAPFLSSHRVTALGRAGNPDFIFIAGGTNDWNASKVPLGQYRTENFTDSVSFRGAYQRLLWKLTKKYPQAKVVCLSIFPRGNGVNDKNSQGWSQADANASIKHIAEQFGQYYVDCTPVPWANNWSASTFDYLHPTAYGGTQLANHIYNKLLSQNIITRGLKRSAEVSEAERLLDISFTADGIVNNGTFEARLGRHGGAATFYDARNDVYYGCTKAKSTDYFYATYDEETPLANAFSGGNVTWEVLVRMDGVADQSGNISRTCILGNEEGNGGWAFYNSPLASCFSYCHQSGVKSSVKSMTGDSILVAGKFYHLVVTMDRMSHIMRYFINGKLVCTGTRAGTDMALPKCGTIKGRKGMWICLGGDASSSSFTGGAENSSACSFVFARVYDGALSQAAAQGLYNDDVKRFTEPQMPYEAELLMDMQIVPDSAINFAPAFRDKPIPMVGEVPVNYNADINLYESVFSGGKNQFFKYALGDEPFMMNTLSDAYSVEVYCRNDTLPKTLTRPLGFLNSYGFGIQMSSKGNIAYSTITQGKKQDETFDKTLWTWTEDGKLTSEYTHYVIVFDRRNRTSRFYIDGELAASRNLTTKECPVYEWTPSTWLAIGGDAKGNFDAATALGSYPFLGEVAMVRIYAKALKETEIQSLRGILTTQEWSYTLGANGYVAACLPFIYQVPEGCTAYVISEIDSPDVKLTPIAQEGEVVPYGTPVIIKGEAKATITLAALNKSEVEGKYLKPLSQKNLLVGTFPGKTLTVGEGYYMKTTNANIYRATGTVSLPAFSCYLPSAERRTYFKLVEEDPTGISDLNANLNQNADEGIYNLSGQRVSKARKGIYIQAGKKIFVQ